MLKALRNTIQKQKVIHLKYLNYLKDNMSRLPRPLRPEISHCEDVILVDAGDFINHPAKYDWAKENGLKVLPTGANSGYVPMDKYDPENLKNVELANGIRLGMQKVGDK